ncbi:cubilin-like isoform X2 [Apostichopus japonicus]|uniref:cubilin-like isoform X2 n=1 Tax=Stichopus japonicus TaxID=307972 RepID=UPI003AB4C1BF
MHLKNNLVFSFVTIISLISQVRPDLDSSRDKRAVDEREQPRIVTTDGHLLFQTGDNHNITFKTGVTGRVVIGDDDLTDIINTVRANKGTIETLQNQLVASGTKLEELRAEIGELKVRLADLENQEPEQPINPDVINQLQTDLNNIKASLQTNECLTSPCANGGTCTNLYNSYQCQCPDGWTGTTCSQDVNECSLIVGTPDGCQNGGTCINEQGSYRCQCTSDWYGFKCTIQYDDCTTASHALLCGHGYCVNEARVFSGTPKYSCICFDGWQTDSSSNNPACSIDVNECDDSPCFEGVTCNNVAGTYFCASCPTGFTGNGAQCYDINECLTNNGGCSSSPSVTCINTHGSRQCGSCPSGYTGDGVRCTYVGICITDNGGCNTLARCTENTGVLSGRTCTCPDGYSGNGEGPNGCTPSAQACSNNPCVYGRCVPEGATYSCVCIPGYTGPNCDSDVNECASDPCLNEGTCVDGFNSYRCNCASGFTGPTCGESSISCGGSYASELGTFSFPGNGQSYPHGATCTWTITTNVDKVLVIQFTSLLIELHESCNYDYVQIFDGPSASSFPLSDRICGSSTPAPITSTHSVVTVKFVSDTNVNADGFTLTWSSLDLVCGGTYDDSNHGTLSSPGYPGNYPVMRDCSWAITVEAGRYMTIVYAAFNLEESTDCSKDYLEVFDGLSDQSPMLGRFCTSVAPSPVETTGPYAFVRFHSDGDGTGEGFMVTYSSAQLEDGCGAALYDDSGIIISPNYPNEYNHNAECIWTIQLPQPGQIEFEVTDLQLQGIGKCDFDYVELRDGFDETAPFVGRYCDSSSLPPPFISSSNQLYIKFSSDSAVAFGGFRATYSVHCGGLFTEDDGELFSPYFPFQYPHDKTCEYLVTAGPDQRVQITFVSFSIENEEECTYDYLQAHDGATEDAPVLGRYCGTDVPALLTTTQSSLYLKFVTDGSVSNLGFRATYSFVDDPSAGCGGSFTGTTGIITSPTHPDLYPHSIHCLYVIEVPSGSVVRLTFSSFFLESHSSCGYDYVEVYDNSTTTGNALLGRYCGTTSPPVLTSSGNVMTIVFHTDGSVAYDGFTSHYVALNSSTVCGGSLTAQTGIVTSPGYPAEYFANADCVWTITVPTGRQIAVNFTSMNIQSTSGCLYDSLELRNGGYDSSPLMATLCGTSLPSQLYVSHSNQLYLRFRSNAAVALTGFSLTYDGTATGCGGILATPTGSFTSPNYPNAYHNHANCVWTVSVSEGSRITLMFTAFDLEDHSSCVYDSLKVYDGPDQGGNLLGSFCGQALPPIVTSSTHQLYIRYTTDGSVTGNGFMAMYRTDCQDVRLTRRTGYIESLNYPEPYPHNQDCSWILEAPLGNPINITFLDIDLEAHVQCSYDYLRLYDGEEATSTVLANMCGDQADGSSFTSSGNHLRLEFHSDISVAHDGFRAYYTIMGCGDDLTGNSGQFMSLNYPEPYEHSRTCEWTITVENGHSITLSIEDIDLEQSTSCLYDSLEIYTGSDDSGMLLAQLCNQNAQKQQVSTTGNQMFIRFTTDENVNGGGFNATYLSNPGGCGGNYSTSTGVIHSLNYPDVYPHNSDCSWLITVGPGSRVELTFNALHLEAASCVYDHIRVYDGDSVDSPLLLTACGNALPSPPTLSSTDNVMFVRMISDTSVAHTGFQATYVTACGGRRDVTTSGYITSPNYPQPYTSNQNCSWVLESSNPTDRITVTFVALDLETSPDGCFDYVQVSDGNHPLAAVGPEICGTAVPSPITSYGSSLVVDFISDGSNHGSGFKMFYSTAGSACGGDYNAVSGTFTSPGYPDSYSQGTECVWRFTTVPGSRLQVSFLIFDIEASANCSTDFLEFRETDQNGAVLNRFCGDTVPSTMTFSSAVWMRFQSDDASTARGFVGSFQQVFGDEVTGSSGQIVSPNYPGVYPNDLHVTWTITVEDNYYIRLNITDIQIEACPYDELRIYDGPSNQNGILAVICGSSQNLQVYTTGSSAFLEFTTDTNTVGTGFRIGWQQVDTFVTAAPPELTTGIDTTVCNRAFTATAAPQTFTSPGYPDGYVDDLDCRYIITAPPTGTIMVNLTDVNLEDSINCGYDYVRVYDGSTESDQILGSFCGRTLMEVFSTGPTVMIVFHSDRSLNGAGFSVTFKQHCGGVYRMQDGLITSPGYPTGYPNDLDCTYILETTPGSAIAFVVNDLDLEESASCIKDSFQIFNGREESSPPLGAGTFCGSNGPENHLISSSNFIRVHFVSDGSGSGDGFSFSYITLREDCGGIFTLDDSNPSSVITSPDYPTGYPNDVDCQWNIRSPAGTVIQATFADLFHIESHSSCRYDFVELRDGTISTSDVLGSYCGETAPYPVISTANAMRVRFRTDISDQFAGFSLTASIAQCGGMISGTSGTITSPGYPDDYPDDVVCEWIFQGPIVHYLTIKFTSFALQPSTNCTNDFLAVYDGRNSSGPLLGKFCGSSAISSIDTSHSEAYLKFVSDSSVATAGFSISFEASEQVCGGDLQTPTGLFSSPGYPRDYDHRRVCQWRITVEAGHLINLNFVDLDIESHSTCLYDSVRIYNGLEEDAPLITSVCGVVPPDVVSSSGNTMRVVFTTDGSENGRGFQASYNSRDASICGDTLQTTPPSLGIISSPGYGLVGQTYSDNLACDWTLSNTQIVNSSLYLAFDEGWGLEPGTNCIHDYLEIRRGVDQNAPLIARLCGGTVPPSISSPWNTLFIRFRTDISVGDKGFKILYKGTDCGGIVTGTSGVITSPNFPAAYRDEDHCAWLIEAPEGAILSMTFTNFSLEVGVNCQNDHVMIKNGGNWDSPSISGEYGWCDTNPPSMGPIVSSSHQAIVIFDTDGSINSQGFRLEWTTETQGCGGTLQSNSGSIQSSNYPQAYGANEECVWIISVETGYNVILTFEDGYDVQSGDSVTIYDGSTTNANVIQIFNTSAPSATVQSSFTMMTIKFRSDANSEGTGFRATWSTGCGGNLGALTGRITSQGYPSRYYDDNSHCEYIIEGQEGNKLLIFFDDRFDLEAGSDCAYDYLNFYEGRDSSGRLLGSFCDSIVPDQIETFGPVFVVFHTDGDTGGNGFGFRYEPGCGGTYTQESGTLGTPRHLDTYRNAQNCTFLIQVEEGKSVQLRFASFELEVHPACNYDYLVVYDGSNTSTPLTGKLCGNTPPDQLTSTANTMLLNFVTDSSRTFEGFQATYQAVFGPSAGCGGSVTADAGSIQSLDVDNNGEYEPYLSCTWNIALSDNNKNMRLEFEGDFDIASPSSGCIYDFLEIRDGFGRFAPLIGSYCGSVSPPAILLSGAQAYVRFVTDSRDSGAGFTLNYSAVNRTCGGTLQATNEVQVLQSPGYPNPYPDSTRCTWVISAADAFDKVLLTTTDIDMEDHTACMFDYVQISSFPLSTNGDILQYCGQNSPPPYRSVGQGAQVYLSTDHNSAGRGFSINYQIADCNQNVTSGYGHLMSPGYPVSYHSNHDCTTRLTSPPGTFLTLYFDNFVLEGNSRCPFDYLRIRDGPSSTSSEVFFGCGSFLPNPIFASSNQLYLKFFTDGSETFEGYQITYTSSSVSRGCGGPLAGTSGSFTSPSFPEVYPSNLTCEWSVAVPARRQPVSLEFTVFNVEGTEGVCQEDFVEVYAGSTSSDPLIGRYCGTNIPAKITATVNIRNLFIRFVTNSANAGDTVYSGFRAVYTS